MAAIQQYQLYHTQQIEMLGWTADQAQFFTAFRNDFDNLNLDLTGLEAQVAQNSANITTNANDISTNSGNIATNSSNIATNTTNIGTNTTNINNNTTAINSHIAATTAHGVTGSNVGTGDFAQTATGGVVFLSDLVNNANSSAVSVTSPDATAAPVAYDQTQVQTIVTLANEMKGDINQLVSDVNDAITQFNDLLQQMKDANQMSTV